MAFEADLAANGCRVFACCGPLAAQTGGGRPPSSLNSNAVKCVWLVGPLGCAGLFMGSAALHCSHPGLEFSLRPGMWSRWRYRRLFLGAGCVAIYVQFQ